MKIKRIKCLTCSGPTCFAVNGVNICKEAIRCWKSNVRDTDGNVILSRGCTTDFTQLSFCGSKNSTSVPSRPVRKRRAIGGTYAIECCMHDLCNDGPFPLLPPGEKPNDSQDYSYAMKIIQSILGPMFALMLVSVMVVAYMRRSHRRKLAAGRPLPLVPNDTVDGEELTSGSGLGFPYLIRRTLSKQIKLEELIGKGKYGEVRRGMWNGDNVAVKIFATKDEISWKRELEIYSLKALRHDNILAYIGSDTTGYGECTELWLVTRYHREGSLYDYLNRNVLDFDQALKICCSVVKGLLYLHTEIKAHAVDGCAIGDTAITKNKPAIAHRDVKSKNILVSDPGKGECVLADFGLAVTHVSETGEIGIPGRGGNNGNRGGEDGGSGAIRVGTKRYMAPEILNETINVEHFDSFMKADIYALSLVFWEICRAIQYDWKGEQVAREEYQPPFYEFVPADPSFDQMWEVVCGRQERPGIPERWRHHPILNEMVTLMKECWNRNPDSRLPILRVQKRIFKMNETMEGVLRVTENSGK